MSARASLTGEKILWFLHADCTMSGTAVMEILSALKDCRIVAGCFRLRLQANGTAYRICDDLDSLAADVIGLSCGDHGIFFRRCNFQAVGGYTDSPIM